MKNVLKKPLTITLATLLLASQPGMASIAAFAAEAPAGGTQAIQGRSLAPVYVKTAAELKAAMINSSVKDIIFTADINWSGTINQKGSKSIYGNNHKINFNGGNIYGDWDSVNELYDMTVENGGAWGGFFGGTDNTINSFHNVSFTGANTQAAFNVPNGTLNLSGNIYVSSSAKDAIQAARVNIDQSAIVTIYSSASALNITPDTVGKLPSHLMINDKATVTLQGGIASNAINNTSKAMVFNWGSLYANGGSAAYASNGGKVFLDETSTSEFTSKSGVAFTGGLEIADNANLSIKTGGGVAADFSQSIGFTAAPKANFVIEATNKAIIGDSGTPVSLQPTQGISVWNISSDPKGAPTNAYAFSKAEFKIDNSGLVAGMVTDSPTFASTFNNAYIKKIAYGSYSVNVAEHNRQAAAENAVKDLFNNSDVTGTIKDTTNQEAIDNAQKAIDAVTDATKKAELQKGLDEAQKQLDAKNAATEAEKARQEAAEKAVKDLFNNSDVTGTIKDATDQEAIDNAQKAIDAVTDATKKAELQKGLDEAQKQLDAKNAATEAEKARQEAAENAVKDLFNNGDVTGTIKDATDQAAIDNAQKAIDAVTDTTKKAELQKGLDEAQKQLDAKNAATEAEKARQEAAENAVKDLFNNGDVTGTIKDATDQEAIDNAQKAIDAVTDTTKKAELQKGLDEAQKQLDAKNAATEAEKARQEAAEKAVKDLFNNSDVTGTIKNTTDQAAIDNAQKAIDAVTDTTKKAALQKDLDEAQKQLNNRNAVLDAPTINKYEYLDSFVTGKVSAGTATVSLYVNGVRVKRATPDASGNYKFDAYGLGLNDGVTFEVRPVDANGKEGTAAIAKVEGKNILSNALTANDAGISTSTITGTVGNGIDNVRLSIDGVIVKVGQISNGTYSIATNGLIKAGSVVQVVGYSKTKVELARVTVKIVNDEKPTLSPLTTDDDMITGYVTAGSATSFRVSINGVAVKTGTVAANGTFQSSIGKQAVGTEVKIEIRDATGYNALRVSTITVTGSAVAKLDAPTLVRMDGNYIIGTAVKGTETVVLYEDGVAKRTISAAQMTTNPDGSLSFRGYVAPGTKNVQAAAKNSDKRMNSVLSASFEL